jgi:hypothetical protein
MSVKSKIYYTKISGDIIHNSYCYFNLCQFIYTVLNGTLLDLVFINFYDIGVSGSSGFYLSVLRIVPHIR